MSFTTPPPEVPNTLITFPRPHILVVTLSNPRSLNALRRASHLALARLWTWYDNEPSLRCAVITGTGRAFCAGADLKEWDSSHDDKNAAAKASNTNDTTQSSNANVNGREWMQNGGFGGMSNRRGRKPIIAAVNGLCLGGGMEMVLNADMIVAASSATFGLPEVKRGVVAIAGALPRLTRIVGRQRAAEMALLGRTTYTATEMRAWGVVNCVVNNGEDSVLEEALRWAEEVVGNSPDSVMVTREGLMGGWKAEDPAVSTVRVWEGDMYRGLEDGENVREGVRSFVEKRKPRWRDSKL